MMKICRLIHDSFSTGHFSFPTSPSQGPCCTAECTYKGRNEKCREESECAHQGMCNGVSAQCPTSEPKANFTACHGETQVCLNGVNGRSPCTWKNRLLWQLYVHTSRCLISSCPHAPPPQGCSGSICEKYGLEACTCASQDGKDETELCHVCCMEKSESFTLFFYYYFSKYNLN